MIDPSRLRPAQPRDQSPLRAAQPRPGSNGYLGPLLPVRGRRPPPRDMDDLAYLVNQVQRRSPPLMHTRARFAEDQQEPTVLIFDADSGELVWSLSLTELVQLAARFFRLNSGLIVSERAADRADGSDQLEPGARPRPSGMNDLAFLANQMRPQQRVQQAQAELVDHPSSEEPTILVVDSTTDNVVLGIPLTDLLRLAHHLRLDTGLVFQGEA